MKHTYKITGMTCNGCRTSVEHKLNALTNVVNAEVNLEKAEAIIEMHQHISLETIQKALPEKYYVEEIKEKTTMVNSEFEMEQEKSELRQLFPLFLIFGYITIAAVLMNRVEFAIDAFMLDFMGLFYIVFSFFKLLDLKGFPDSFRMYDPLAKMIPTYAWIYPFIETALGVMFLMQFQVTIALWTTIVILGLTTIGVTKVLLDKKSIQCACLGTALKLPMTKATFIENSIMLIMAILMLLKF